MDLTRMYNPARFDPGPWYELRRSRIADFAVYSVVLFLILAYAAGSSVRQSFVLALVLAGVVWAIERRALAPRSKLRPYRVRVHPHWHKILQDFKLLDGCESISVFLENVPANKYCLLRDDLRFEVVSEDASETLIFFNSFPAFVSQLRFFDALNMIRIDSKTHSVKIREWGSYREDFESDVHFFLQPGLAGYDLGIQVPEAWWMETNQSCPKPLREENRAGWIEKVDLILATIPYQEFHSYWRLTDMTGWLKTSFEISKQIKEHRRGMGWKWDDSGEYRGTTERVEHTYFTVTHDKI